MKNILSLLTVAAFAFAVSACESPPQKSDKNVSAAVGESPVELQVGFVRVIVEPAEAAAINAWHLRGFPEPRPSESMVGVAPGYVPVVFAEIEGFKTPRERHVLVQHGKTTTIVARYEKAPG